MSRISDEASKLGYGKTFLLSCGGDCGHSHRRMEGTVFPMVTNEADGFSARATLDSWPDRARLLSGLLSCFHTDWSSRPIPTNATSAIRPFHFCHFHHQLYQQVRSAINENANGFGPEISIQNVAGLGLHVSCLYFEGTRGILSEVVGSVMAIWTEVHYALVGYETPICGN